MLKVLRIITLIVLLLVWFVIGMLVCLARPRHKNNVYYLSRMLNCYFAGCWALKLNVLSGMNAEHLALRCMLQIIKPTMTSWYWDVSCRAISMGKQSLAWDPLFGQVYYLSGNILIDRAS